MIYGACPWYTALSVVTFISVSVIPIRTNKAEDDIVKCHLNQPLPFKSVWAVAYANDKDTNYIISRLRTNKSPWVETEIHTVHKEYWQ